MKIVLNHCNISHLNKSFIEFCSSYCMGKAHGLPSHNSTSVYSPLELIFTDLWGPSHVPSYAGYTYYVFFIDAFSKYTWIFLINSKAKTISVFQNFKSMVELQLNTKIKSIQSDWRSEYRPFSNLLASFGISHRLIYHFLETFGCACFPLLRPYHTHKLNFRSQECLFQGYSSSHKGYKCLSSSGRVYISKDVLFNELRFPYSELFPSSSSSTKSLDSYFSLSPNISPPCVATIPQITQTSPTNSGFVPLIPPRFSPLPTHSPITIVFVPPPYTSSTSIFVVPQNSESTTYIYFKDCYCTHLSPN